MYSINGVKNRRAQPMIMPVIIPDKPVFAPLSLLTADLEKEPARKVREINPLFFFFFACRCNTNPNDQQNREG